MTSALRHGAGVPPWTLAVTAMFSVQLSSALSVGLIDSLGPAGTAWVRLSLGALIFIAVARPSVRSLRRGDLPGLVGLGVATGLMSIAFLGAVERIPLGTAVAIEFLGPLTVAALHGRNLRAMTWPGIALAGVSLVTRPWAGDVNLAGMVFAGLAALGWATYILLTQRVGDRFGGLQGLSFTIPVAAATAAVVGVPQAAGHLTPSAIAEAAGLAILLPVLPFALEMFALRRMTHAAFGTLMALEPAIGVVLGFLVLGQRMTTVQLVGVSLVVIAGAAAQRGGERSADSHAVPGIRIGGEYGPDTHAHEHAPAG